MVINRFFKESMRKSIWFGALDLRKTGLRIMTNQGLRSIADLLIVESIIGSLSILYFIVLRLDILLPFPYHFIRPLNGQTPQIILHILTKIILINFILQKLYFLLPFFIARTTMNPISLMLATNRSSRI